MTDATLNALCARLMSGQELPRRVVVSADGAAVKARRAARDYGVYPELVFIRDDGWTLGAPRVWAGVAYAMWSKHWAAIVPLDPVRARLVNTN